MLVLFITFVLDFFLLHVFCFGNFSTLPFAVNVAVNLSNKFANTQQVWKFKLQQENN